MSIYVRDYDSLAMRMVRIRNLVALTDLSPDRAYCLMRRLNQLRQAAPEWVSPVRVSAG